MAATVASIMVALAAPRPIWPRVNTVEIRITVEREEPLAQQRDGAYQGAARTEWLWAIERVPHVNVPARTVSNGINDEVTEVANTEHHVGHTVAPQKLNLVNRERLTGHFQ